MTNIRFPKTDLVECVFCYRQSNNAKRSATYDEFDRMDPIGLKRYVYRVPKCLDGQLKFGDTVLVHCQTGYQICMVFSINVLSDRDKKTIAPVVCKCDLTSYIDEIEQTKKLKVMRAQIEAEKKRLESMVTYELIAEKNPEFKAMLEAFKDAGGEF